MLVVSCDAIPGYMAPMEMSFAVRDARSLSTLTPGSALRFTIVKRNGVLYAEKLALLPAANLEAEPMEVGSLSALTSTLSPVAAAKVVQPGQSVPDFVLTDQTGSVVHFSQFEGKVVALTFGYSRCPNPQYCYRLSNNLARVEKRFSTRAGRDLVLLTVAIDPEHDQGAALKEYAAEWHADARQWHFLTGPVADVRQVAGMFGMNFWREEGLLTHGLHTVVIDRQGMLVANLEGNQFTAQQLGDLVGSVMDGSR
jgi:protein SCO1/2